MNVFLLLKQKNERNKSVLNPYKKDVFTTKFL